MLPLEVLPLEVLPLVVLPLVVLPLVVLPPEVLLRDVVVSVAEPTEVDTWLLVTGGGGLSTRGCTAVELGTEGRLGSSVR